MRVLLVRLQPLDNEPMGLLYIGTALQKAGHTVRLTGTANHNPAAKLLKEISLFKPDVVGFAVTTMFADKAQLLAHSIKRYYPEISIIAGGAHPTILPFETLKGGNIDVCILGEGDVTVVKLLETLKVHGDLEKVKGIAFLKNKGMIKHSS